MAAEVAAAALPHLSESDIWRQIDLSESYMVSCMFEEATSLAASVIKQIHTSTSIQALGDTQLADMMESAGMVFVQSLKELGRTSELLDELKMLFGSVAAVPVQVFLTGVCMQVSEGYSSNLRTIVEEFLEKWVYLKDEGRVLPKTEFSFEGCLWQSSIPVKKYLEVADVYAITILGTVLHKPDVAISWTEMVGLPDEKRQEMLRRLHSLHLAAHSSSSVDSETTKTAKGSGALLVSGTSSALSMGQTFPKNTKVEKHPNGGEPKSATAKSIQLSIKRISDRTVWLKLGNFGLVLPRGKIVLLSSLMLFILYFLQKRRAALKRIVTKQVSSIRRALIDVWQLAFSVQVNPLAAVQQLPSTASRGGSR